MTKITDVLFSFYTKRHKFGPCLGFLPTLVVESTDYADVVAAITHQMQDYTNISILKFTNSNKV